MGKAIFDASLFLSFLLPDEDSNRKVIDKFIKGEIGLIEPFVFNLEVVNSLRFAFASKRIKKKGFFETIAAFQNLAKLSLKHDLSIYDACYLHVAQETGLQLYSLNKKLKKFINIFDPGIIHFKRELIV